MTHFTAQSKPSHLIGTIAALDGDTWEVIGVGCADADGFTVFHLASTTRFIQQKNGKRPIQRMETLHPDILLACAAMKGATNG